VTLRDSRVLAIAGLLAVISCSEPSLAPGPPPAPPVRDVLFRYENGSLYLIRTDGGNRRPIGPASLPPFTPLALTSDGRTVALLAANQIALALVEDLSTRQVIYVGQLANTGPAAFSDDDRHLAIPCYVENRGPAVLLFDRSLQRWDTVIVEAPGFTMGPAFSPDGSELAGLGETALAIFVIRVRLSDLHVFVDQLGASRFLNLPYFGWPRWTARDGFMFLVRRGYLDGGRNDSLAVVATDPDNPQGGVTTLYSVLQSPDSGAPSLVIGPQSTFALSRDGSQVILTAYADSSLRHHALWAAARGGRRVYAVLADSTQRLLYPHLLN
jgi:hypothetical protein